MLLEGITAISPKSDVTLSYHRNQSNQPHWEMKSHRTILSRVFVWAADCTLICPCQPEMSPMLVLLWLGGTVILVVGLGQ